MKKDGLIIATDLDGTLLDSGSDLSGENLDAIISLYKNNIETMVLTGRTYYEIPKSLRECECISYYVFSNGAGIMHRDGGLIDYNPIDDELAKRIFDILNEYESFVELYTGFAPYVDESKYSDEAFEYYRVDECFIPEMHRSRRPVKSLDALINSDDYKTEMFNVLFRYENERAECRARLEKEFEGLEISSSMRCNLEIMKKGFNKATGLKRVCEYAGFDIANVLAVGDSKNDIPAFEVAGMKYAVSNACSDLKAIADKIICSNDENVMCYLEKELCTK